MTTPSDQDIVDFLKVITGATPEEAKYFLEMSNNNLENAILLYQDPRPSSSDKDAEPIPRPVAEPSSSIASNTESAPLTARTTRAKNTKNETPKFRTLQDLMKGDDDDDEDDGKRQNFFTGGEKSGLAVEGPDPSRNQPDSSLIDDILKKAAEGSSAPEETPVKKPNHFTGRGHRLGDEGESSRAIEPEPSQASEELEPAVRLLTFWRDGFSVEDGPLHRYDDPKNKVMLNAINSGLAPLSLLNVQHDQPVEVRVAQRRDEDYVPPPKAPPKPFEGHGHRLGGPSSSVAGTLPGAFPASSSAVASSASVASDLPSPEVDENLPTTRLQIRLLDGSRRTLKLNLHHRVRDIYQYVAAAQPGQEFVLQTGLPPKVLEDYELSLEEAALKNAAIVQRKK